MANWTEPNEKQFEVWLKDHQPVAEIARKYPPWKLWRMDNGEGYRCFVISYDQTTVGVRVTVAVTGMFNLINFGRRVFGIDPGTLVECDLPAEGEPLGEIMNDEEQFQHINQMRAQNGVPLLTREEYDDMKGNPNSGGSHGKDETQKH